MLFIIGGASGSGKTGCLQGLKNALPTIDWHDFDDVGVPERPIPDDWRITTTEAWLQKAIANQQQGMDTGLTGGAVYGEVLACPSAPDIDGLSYCLLDCADPIRIERIRSRARGRQSASQEMLNWAAWLRMHAAEPAWCPDVIRDRVASVPELDFDRWSSWQKGDPRWRVHLIDNSELDVDRTIGEIVSWIEDERRRHAQGPG